MNRCTAARPWPDRRVRKNPPGYARVNAISVASACRVGFGCCPGGGSGAGSAVSRPNTGSLVYCAIPLPRRNGRYARSRSRGRHPSTVGSGATTTARQPHRPARPTRLETSSSDLLQYSWNQCGTSPKIPATSSIGREAWLEKITGMPMIFSNQASRPMEEVAGILGDVPHWFQLYWSKSDELVSSLVGRAGRCGCRAVVVAPEPTVLGWRPRDLERAYLPFLRGKGIAQYTSDPVFGRLTAEPAPEPPPGQQPKPTLHALATLIALTRAYPGGFFRTLRSGHGRAAVQRFIDLYSRPSLRWEDLPFLRERTELPIVLKGILHPEDAARAIDAGVDGIVVSNHGGRQVDGAIATLEALPN